MAGKTMIELMKIQCDLKVRKGRDNDFAKYKYRNLDDINQAVKPLLEENQCSLILSDEVIEVGGRVYIKATATIINKEGNSVSVSANAREPLLQKGLSDGQLSGATSSYARKYALGGLFAIDDSEDFDTMDNRDSGTYEELVENIKVLLADGNDKGLVNLWSGIGREQQVLIFKNSLSESEQKVLTEIMKKEKGSKK
jgi:hypothetical protein